MGAGFEVLSRVFVNVGRSQDAVNSPLGRQGNRTNGSGVGAVSRVYNSFAGHIKQTAIEGFEADANLLLLNSSHSNAVKRDAKL